MVSDVESVASVEPAPTRMCPSCGNTTLVKKVFYNGESDIYTCLKCGWRRFL